MKSKTENNNLVEENLSLVRSVAGRMAPRLPSNISKEELIGPGVIGLFDAIEKFDSNQGAKFETYARFRVRGAILDEVRKMDWVSRSDRKIVNRIEDVCYALSQELGRKPYDYEIAWKLEIEDLDEYHKIAARAESPTSFNIDEFMLMPRPILKESLEKISSTNSIPEKIYKKELSKIIRNSISRLSEQQKKVLSLYYYDELTLKEISNIMDLTESRISQIRSKAVIKLRDKIRIFYKEIFNENYIPKQTSQK